mmetsp:Transcript_1008/g.2092  ORF Transcript_1008/g.2092 Transcript_1008/m.2092 type:complete len:294 (-) Transcript_1008:1410-2291(-)
MAGYEQYGGFSGNGNGEAGGGFVNSPMNDDGSASKKSFGGRGNQTVLPVTIKQLLQADLKDEGVFIDGAEIGQVTVVGVISEISMESTGTSYMIDDSTGTVNVKTWVSDDDGQDVVDSRNELQEGKYVRVTGTFRAFNGAGSLSGHVMYAIKDFNEVTFHLLESLSVHLKNKKGVFAVEAPSQQASMSVGAAAESALASTSGQPIQSATPGFGSSGAHYTMQEAEGDFDPCTNAVLAMIKAQGATDVGCGRESIYRELAARFSKQNINNSLALLNDEGHVYTTTDDDHFKTTS